MKKNILILLTASFILFSCSERFDQSELSSNIAAEIKSEAYEEDYTDDYGGQEGNEETEKNQKIDIPSRQLKNIDRKLIKDGSISFETSDTKATKSVIEKATKKFKGYLSEDNEYDYGYRIQHNVTIRVPSANFDKLLAEISTSINEIDDQNISVKDVTEEYVDVQARLKAKKEVEKRYIQLLSKAHSVGDILQVENELARLREQIEATEGRLRYLKDQVSLSTLRITFYQTRHADESFGFGKKVKKGFENGYKGLLWFIIGLINIWPFLLFLSIGIWLLVRLIKKSRAKRRL